VKFSCGKPTHGLRNGFVKFQIIFGTTSRAISLTYFEIHLSDHNAVVTDRTMNRLMGR
jgi:hypothetical protein